jgi:hypothetical protein
MAEQKNEGEGNRTAARAFDREQQRFAQSGKVEEAAREAERAMKDPEERRKMEKAEQEGKSHSRGEA